MVTNQYCTPKPCFILICTCKHAIHVLTVELILLTIFLPILLSTKLYPLLMQIATHSQQVCFKTKISRLVFVWFCWRTFDLVYCMTIRRRLFILAKRSIDQVKLATIENY